ncbi:hypothetical protein [Planomonospora sp. ID82291]|uniref:hypothetical protein n=1 Tax=Planomonospora sp. ID82291 TaxID=2738136 RepID=UPI0018C36FE7|nr:hypothetical protein [Planomonospora sp. ID82291]MBG0818293.1 hypothetical protein [Planomonospora sp. ID82291]
MATPPAPFFVPSPPPFGVVLDVPAALAGKYAQAQAELALALSEAGLEAERQPGGVYVTITPPRPGWSAVAFPRFDQLGYVLELRFALTAAPGAHASVSDGWGRFVPFARAVASCLSDHDRLLPR